jgi:hypothetical protein
VTPTPTAQQEQETPAGALALNIEAYRPLLSDAGMTPERETQFLEALWATVVSFVDLGFGRDPVQQALNVSNRNSTLAGDSDAVLGCKDAFNKQTEERATQSKRRAGRKKDS